MIDNKTLATVKALTDGLTGSSGNVADGLFAIAVAINRIAPALNRLADAAGPKAEPKPTASEPEKPKRHRDTRAELDAARAETGKSQATYHSR